MQEKHNTYITEPLKAVFYFALGGLVCGVFIINRVHTNESVCAIVTKELNIHYSSKDKIRYTMRDNRCHVSGVVGEWTEIDLDKVVTESKQ